MESAGFVIREWILEGALVLGLSAIVSACSTTNTIHRPAPPSSQLAPASAPTQYGVASWYGPGFDGHRTSSGEIYDENDLTAASTYYPLGSRVMVTNLGNGRAVEVTINDRGPFLKGRKIDLSHRAASVIGMIGPGTTNVRIDLLAAPYDAPPLGAPARYYVQVGAFSDPVHARRMRDALSAYYRDVRIEQVDAGVHRYYRVRMGAFASHSSAEERALETARRGYQIIVVSE